MFHRMLYNAAKKSHGGERASSRQNVDLRTSQVLAKQYGVTPRTNQNARIGNRQIVGRQTTAPSLSAPIQKSTLTEKKNE